VIVLAGDVGGTNSRFALFQAGVSLFERTYPSASHPSMESVIQLFLQQAAGVLGGNKVARACLAIAGPVDNGTARFTNLTWAVDERVIERETGIPRVRLANDFQAAAFGVTLLGPDQLLPLGGGPRQPTGPVVVAGAGTGLGAAFLIWVDKEKRHQVIPSEAGHADFAPRTPLETGLLDYLIGRYGRVSYDRVLSGPGLRDTFDFLMTEPACRLLATEETKRAMVAEDPAAVITRQGQKDLPDPLCLLTLNLFASMYGALAGSLALTLLATGGVFIAGGIAPRITRILQQGTFREAFEAKGRFQPFLAKVPVQVVMNREVGLLGAAALAAQD
jgi:glucokinase